MVLGHVDPLFESFQRGPQLVIVPLVTSVITGNTHPQKFMQTYAKRFA